MFLVEIYRNAEFVGFLSDTSDNLTFDEETARRFFTKEYDDAVQAGVDFCDSMVMHITHKIEWVNHFRGGDLVKFMHPIGEKIDGIIVGEVKAGFYEVSYSAKSSSFPGSERGYVTVHRDAIGY